MNSRKKDKIINIDKKENTQIPALHVSFNPNWRFSWHFNVLDILLAVSLTFFKNDFDISIAVFLERKLSTSTTTGNHQILISDYLHTFFYNYLESA